MDTSLFSSLSSRLMTPSNDALEFYNNFPVIEVLILFCLTLITIFRRQLSSNDQYRVDGDTIQSTITISPTVSSIIDELIDASKDTTSSLKKYINTRNLLNKQNKNNNITEKNNEHNLNHQFTNSSSFIFPIPNELLLHIITYLNIVDLHKLMIVSNASLKLLKSDYIWKQLWFKNFGSNLWKNSCMIEIKNIRNIEWNYNNDDNNFTPKQGWYKFYIEFNYCWINWFLAGLCTVQNCYVGLNGKIYYLSPFLNDHPGSPETLLESSGCDCTAHYKDIGHSKYATLLANNYLTFSPSDYSIKFNKDINKIKTPDMIFILEDEENIKKLLKYNANNIFANNEFNELIHSIENISVLNKFDKKVYGLNDNFKVCSDLVTIANSTVGKYNLKCNTSMHYGQCKSFYDPIQQQWFCWWSCCGDAHKITKK